MTSLCSKHAMHLFLVSTVLMASLYPSVCWPMAAPESHQISASNELTRNEIIPSKPGKNVRCWATEPCKYLLKDNRGMLGYKEVPTWCHCHADESCEYSHEDSGIRALVYRCFKQATADDAISASNELSALGEQPSTATS